MKDATAIGTYFDAIISVLHFEAVVFRGTPDIESLITGQGYLSYPSQWANKLSVTLPMPSTDSH